MVQSISKEPVKPEGRAVLLQLGNTIFFVVMVIINALADFIPINGKTTGQISEQYPNLFVPAGITFSIWSIIYFFLFLFCIYLLSGLSKNANAAPGKRELITKRIGYLFLRSCVLNISWILAWHYEQLFLSFVIMIGLLLTLVQIYNRVHPVRTFKRERFFVMIPFSIYLGWISIATMANATALLVSLQWAGWGISQEVWASILIISGLIISGFMVMNKRDVYFALVVIWAFIGIIIRQYMLFNLFNIVAITAMAAILILLLIIVWQVRISKKV